MATPKKTPAKAPAKVAPAKAAAPTSPPNAPGGTSYVGSVGAAPTAAAPTAGGTPPVRDPDVVAAETALGVPLSMTPPSSATNAGSYTINGVSYWPQTDQQQQYADGPGFTGAQQSLLAALSDPYMNAESKARALQQYQSGEYAQTYNTTKRPDETYDEYHARVNAAAAAGNATKGAAGGSGGLADPAQTAKDASNRDALAILKQTFATYGLPDTLSDFAWQEIVNGKSQNEVMLDLYQRPEFKQEFPEIDARQKAGLAPVSPGEIVSYRKQASELMRAAGLPQGFYDSKDDFSGYLSKDVSLNELSSRITDAAQMAYNTPAEDRQQFYDLGFGHGDLTAMFLNPDIAEPLLNQQATAAHLSGTGVRSGFGALNATEALNFAQQGVTPGQAEQGFGNLVRQQELFNPLNAGETSIGRQDQLNAALGGNAAAQQRITDRARGRQAEFAGGGNFASSQTGLSGLGGSQN